MASTGNLAIIVAGISVTSLGFGIIGAAYTAYNAIEVYREKELPRFYDKASTRQIIKQRDIALYLDKERDYAKAKEKLAELSGKSAPNVVSANEVASILHELRSSPFYDKTAYKPMYRNLWTLQTRLRETPGAGGLTKKDLDPASPCLKTTVSANNDKKDVDCTTQQLLMDLLNALHHEDGPSEKAVTAK